jgi:hypothetical protein
MISPQKPKLTLYKGKNKEKENIMTSPAENSAGTYYRVGSKSGPLVIGGALKKMSDDSTFTYVPMFKKAAPLDEMEKWLQDNHPSQKEEALRGAFNLKNLKKKSVRSVFDREIENAQEERHHKNEQTQRRRNFNLETVIQLYKAMVAQRKETKSSSEGSSSKRLSFKDRVKALKNDGVVWDVSNMNEKGHRGRRIEGKRLSTLDDVRRLSNDKTDRFYYVVYKHKLESSVEGVRNFLSRYGGFKDSQIKSVTDSIREGHRTHFNKGKSPTASPVPMLSPKPFSPKNSRKAKKSGKSSKKDEDEDEDDVFGALSDL